MYPFPLYQTQLPLSPPLLAAGNPISPNPPCSLPLFSVYPLVHSQGSFPPTIAPGKASPPRSLPPVVFLPNSKSICCQSPFPPVCLPTCSVAALSHHTDCEPWHGIQGMGTRPVSSSASSPYTHTHTHTGVHNQCPSEPTRCVTHCLVLPLPSHLHSHPHSGLITKVCFSLQFTFHQPNC